MHLGKQGVTDNFIQTLNNALTTHASIRIPALKSSGRDRESITKMADEIVQKVTAECNYRILGFTIILKKLANRKKK